MKLGISSYSLYQAMNKGEMTITDVIDYVAEIGGEHIEIVPLGFNLKETPALIDTIKSHAASTGIEISNYAIGANFADLDDAAYEAEIERVKGEVDIAAALGVKLMRHDVGSSQDLSITHFLKELPRMADACRIITEYAAARGITTSVENHGNFIQHSDRVKALVQTVNHPNFKTTLDVGNFLCADEVSTVAVANNIGLASMVHFKDFYYRPASRPPGSGWFNTSSGNWLRGAIIGQGDIDMPEVVRIVKESGYDGYISIEFEGLEDCRIGTKYGLEYVRKAWNEV